jgi:glycosyltransferase involved in cell wall biosynthesis
MDSSRLNILTFTTVFPNPIEPGNGPFVRRRVQNMAELAEVTVVAPVPWLDYSNPKGDWRASRRIPSSRTDGHLPVYHPQWLFPPMGTPLNVTCLYRGARATVESLHSRSPFHCIDAHFGYPDGAAASKLARRLGIPYFVTMRGNELVYARDPLRSGPLRAALLGAVGVVAVSEELRALASSLGVTADRLCVIQNGVDAAEFSPTDFSVARARLDVPLARRVILSAGGFGPLKGHHRIVEAMPDLLSRGHDVELWIAGSANRDGRYEAEIRATISRLNLGSRTRLLGGVAPNELALRFSAADVFCLASSYEGCPNVVYEAMACGCPVVSTRVGAVPQMIPSGAFGLIIEVDNQNALERGLGEALSRAWDRNAISLFGRARDWTQVASEVLDFFQSRLSSTPTPAYVRN